MRYFILGIMIFLCLPGTEQVHAQAIENSASDEPVEISAAGTLEWHQKDKQYVAVGEVEAKQGEVTIYADSLVADYYDDEDQKASKGKETASGVKIWQLTATGNVILQNTDSKAVGDKAIYNVETGMAVLTGENLKLTTPGQVITARDRMEYDTNGGVAKAVGQAQIVEGTNRLNAQTITARFVKDQNGKQSLKTATAIGGVTITTPDEVLTGDTGIYNAGNDTAEVKGNVTIKRGPNMLEGARAQVNLTTNVSKMFSGEPGSGKRVKGVFFPGSSKSIPKQDSSNEVHP
ncbi:MAG: LptA/OstA family protein [Alphaproteobacteria bacterium]|nr:LptA/OstA family protein [Alphaproteobacteria bacterium]